MSVAITIPNSSAGNPAKPRFEPSLWAAIRGIEDFSHVIFPDQPDLMSVLNGNHFINTREGFGGNALKADQLRTPALVTDAAGWNGRAVLDGIGVPIMNMNIGNVALNDTITLACVINVTTERPGVLLSTVDENFKIFTNNFPYAYVQTNGSGGNRTFGITPGVTAMIITHNFVTGLSNFYVSSDPDGGTYNGDVSALPNPNKVEPETCWIMNSGANEAFQDKLGFMAIFNADLSAPSRDADRGALMAAMKNYFGL